MKIQHVVFDRDGVLNVEDPAGGYVLTPQAFVWTEGTLQAIERLRDAGVTLSVATNQRCVALGLVSEAGLAAIHRELTARSGIEAIFHCPHDRDAGCRCRKPGPELLERAIARSGIVPEATIFVGDSPTDLQAATAAGIAGWLVRTGKGRATEATLATSVPTFDDVAAVAEAVLAP